MKRKISGFENYEIDKNGIVYKSNKEMKRHLNTNGYYRVYLSKNNETYKKYIHRLVAEAFIPNPKNKTQVNHINGIKTDNRVENLEWVSAKENIQHAFKNGLSFIPKGKDNSLYGRKSKNANRHVAINQYDLKNNFIRKWDTLTEAANTLNIGISGISACCRGQRRKSGGYIWKYEKEI